MPLDKPLNLSFGGLRDGSATPQCLPSSEAQRLIDEVELLRRTINEKDKEIRQLRDEAKRFRKRAQERQGQLNQIAEQNHELSKLNDELKTRESLLKQELSNAEAQMATIEDLLRVKSELEGELGR